MDDRPELAASSSRAPGSSDRRPLLHLFPSGPSQRRDLLVDIPAPSDADATTCEGFYGLSEQPFSLSTDPEFLYHSSAHDRVAQELLTAIRRHDPIAVVTGAVGLGKTILCRAVMEELDRRTLASFVGCPPASPEELLKTMLVDFGVVPGRERLERASSDELMLALRDFLASLVPLQTFAVVFIDEAQSLSPGLFQEIRRLTEISETPCRLQIVLVGQPTLLGRLRTADLKPIEPRIAARCSLGPLEPEEVIEYVSHRLSIAGAHPRVDFSDAAAERIHELSAGVPTVANLLCDRALSHGYRALANEIDVDLVNAAAFELDIAPAEPVGRWLLRDALIIVVFAALVLAGALAAARVFHEPLSRLIIRWGG